MSLQSYFETHPYGPFPRSLEWIYLDRTGGVLTALDSESTFGASDDGTILRIIALSDTTAELWHLIASTHINDPANGWVRPLDYSDTQNAKVWHRLQCFGAGGGGGGTIPATTNVLKGDGAGNAADTGIAAANIVLKAANPTPLNIHDIVLILQSAGLCL